MQLGILGGGQLGRMLALAGAPLGVRTAFFDPMADACAGQVGPLTVADWRDDRAVRRFAESCDVVTYEFENVPAETLAAAGDAVRVSPAPSVLAVSSDRLEEKRAFERIGLSVPPYAPIAPGQAIDAALAISGRPAMLKSRRGGYDGKGQWVIDSADDVERGLAELNRPCLLEARVPFTAEISIAVARGRNGQIVAWGPSRNEHAEGILSVTRGPWPDGRIATVESGHLGLEASVIGAAIAGVSALAEDIAYVGVLAVEFFVVDGTLLANEMAARVHNSFHWTMDFAATGQFEQHVRAVCGWPLGDASAIRPSAMVNLVGQTLGPADLPAGADHRLHLYGKPPRPGRKVGHLNLAANDGPALEHSLSQAMAAVAAAGAEARGQPQPLG
ncbi:MAG: 5-(carboxyamino)imidazole ribonucleotide synthase [Phycisphaerales bacterium]